MPRWPLLSPPSPSGRQGTGEMQMALAKPTASSEGVRSLIRGLQILRYVNEAGGAGPGQISRALNIPRPTVYRLLRTLEEAGYIIFSASSNLARATRAAAALGDRTGMGTEFCQVAAPLLAQYAGQLVWPIDLTVYDNAAMVVQESTHGRSPLSIDRAMMGFRLPVLRTAAGRAYLAFCTDKERTLIIDHVQHLGDPDDAPFLHSNWLDRMIAVTRARGYAIRDDGKFRNQTASIAVPVIAGDTVHGCVSVIWIRSAMTTAKAIEMAVEPLAELASRIARALPEQPAPSTD